MTWRSSIISLAIAAALWALLWLGGLPRGTSATRHAATNTLANSVQLGIDPAAVTLLVYEPAIPGNTAASQEPHSHQSRALRLTTDRLPNTSTRGTSTPGTSTTDSNSTDSMDTPSGDEPRWIVETEHAGNTTLWPGNEEAIRATVRAIAGLRLQARETDATRAASDHGNDRSAGTGPNGDHNTNPSTWTLRIYEGDHAVTSIASTGPAISARVPVRVGLRDGTVAAAWLPTAALAMILPEATSAPGWRSPRPLGDSARVTTRVEITALAHTTQPNTPPNAQSGAQSSTSSNTSPNTLVFVRGRRGWQLETPPIRARLNQQKIDDLVRSFHAIEASSFHADAAPLENPIARFTLAQRSAQGVSEVTRSVEIGGPADIRGSRIRATASIQAHGWRGPWDGPFTASQPIEISREALPSPQLAAITYVDTRIVPWSEEETWSLMVGANKFESGLDGWRRAHGAPVTAIETREIATALTMLRTGSGAELSVDDSAANSPRETASTIVVTRLGELDEVTAQAWLQQDRLYIQSGDLVWSWPGDQIELNWIARQLPGPTP